jgi:hypothetical protein
VKKLTYEDMQKMAYDLDEENFILKEELSELKA